jgi:hypothetical protein
MKALTKREEGIWQMGVRREVGDANEGCGNQEGWKRRAEGAEDGGRKSKRKRKEKDED